MKLKDVPSTTRLDTIVLKMPDDVFKQAKTTGLNTQEVIVTSLVSGPAGYWVKTKATDNRAFPIWGRTIKEVLEWEVVEDKPIMVKYPNRNRRHCIHCFGWAYVGNEKGSCNINNSKFIVSRDTECSGVNCGNYSKL